jgi:hypothetical protein
MSGLINHRLVATRGSGKTTWNDSLVVSGGSHGQVMTRDTAAVDGWSLQARGTVAGVFDVRDYGAKGDGVTDDTAAIQATIDKVTAFAQGGYTIWFPPGIYLMNGGLIVGEKRIIFRGPGLIGSNGACLKTTNPSVTFVDYSNGSTDTCSFYGLMFYGAGVGTGAGNGILMGRSGQPHYDWRVEDCWFAGIPQSCIYGLDIDGGHISNCCFENSNWGVVFVGGLGQGVITNNRFSSLSYAGVEIAAPGAKNITIVGNLFSTCGVTGECGAIYVTNTGAEIRNTLIASNAFGDNYYDVLLVGATSVSGHTGITNTQILSNSCQNAHEISIYVDGPSRTQISGNKITDAGHLSALGASAIVIAGASAETVIDGNVVNSADAVAPNLYGVSLGASTTLTRLGQNDLSGRDGEILIAGGATYSALKGVSGSQLVAAPTLVNSWSNLGLGYSTAGYYKDAGGRVFLSGNITGGTTGPSVAFTLPAGFRPALGVRTSTMAAGAICQVDIATNGEVTVAPLGSAWLALDNISFMAA